MINDKKYMTMLANRGCIVCGKPAQLHHPKSFGCGAGQKCSNWLCIPLCVEHHIEGIHKNGNVDGKDEADLLAMTIQAIVITMNNERIPF